MNEVAEHKKFAILLFVLSLPVLLLLLGYLIFDPFKVLWKYNMYFQSGQPLNVVLDKDYVSTQVFLDNYSEQQYDAFIFGSSTSMFFKVADWNKHVKARACFHFDAAGESLLGVKRKLEFLKTRKTQINQVLFVLDHYLLRQVGEKTGHLYRSHPALNGQSFLDFQLGFFGTYLQPDFLLAFLHFKMSGKIWNYMKTDFLLSDIVVGYNNVTNEMWFQGFEEQITTNPTAYYSAAKMKEFYPRDSMEGRYQKVIAETQEIYLREIAELLKEQHTVYKLVVSPLYNQKKLDSTDLVKLKQIFGEGNVYDFSGINPITSDYNNYYENLHFRSRVGKIVMDSIYGH